MLLFNENKVDEMCKILDSLHKYVPTQPTCKQLTLPNGNVIAHEDFKLYPILLGGDQLTVARAQKAVAIRANHENSKDRLEGIIPVIEDWYMQSK